MFTKKQFREDSIFYYLGKAHTLQFTHAAEITLKDGIIFFPKGAIFRIEKELINWFVQQAREVITRRLEFHSAKMNKIYTGVRLSDTSSKWGTCFADNSLQFNWRLIMAPLFVLDYVIIHELAHTTHKNHGKDFWKEVGLHTPAYRQHRKWLNQNSKLLHF